MSHSSAEMTRKKKKNLGRKLPQTRRPLHSCNASLYLPRNVLVLPPPKLPVRSMIPQPLLRLSPMPRPSILRSYSSGIRLLTTTAEPPLTYTARPGNDMPVRRSCVNVTADRSQGFTNQSVSKWEQISNGGKSRPDISSGKE